MNYLEKRIWNSLLDSDMNIRYLGVLARRYLKRDKYSKIFLAITSSATIASWEIWNKSAWFIKLSWLWQIACALSALVAISLPILDYGKLINTASRLCSNWVPLLNQYEILWSKRKRISDEGIEAEYSAILKKEEQLSQDDVIIPRKNKLIIQCQNEVKKSRGLT